MDIILNDIKPTKKCQRIVFQIYCGIWVDAEMEATLHIEANA